MPAYVASPFHPVIQLLVAGTPSYVWGNFNDKTGPTLGTVVSNSSAGTAGVLNVQILSGNVPIVNSFITVIGTANSGGVFNVTNATITSVSAAANPDAGYYSIGYAVSSTTQATTLDGGQFSVPQIEIGEPLTGTGASAPVASPFNNPEMQEGKSITASVSFPTAPTSATVVLQGALFDKDSEYVTIGTLGTTNASSTFQSGQGAVGTVESVNILNFRFYRLNCTALVGTGTIVGKIEC